MEKDAAPKFASFKPKKNPLDQQKIKAPSGSEPSKQDSLDNHCLGRTRLLKHDAQIAPHRKEHHSSRRSRVDSGGSNSKDYNQKSSTDELLESDLFMIDLRGDRKNVEYGYLHHYEVPRYHRVGYGRLLGSRPDVKIDLEASTGKEVTLTDPRSSREQRPKRLLAARGSLHIPKRSRFVRTDLMDEGVDEQRDFISFRDNSKPMRVPPLADKELDATDYRSLSGQAADCSVGADDDLENVSDSHSDTNDQHLEQKARQINATLSRKVKELPSDLQAWLSLIEHQRTLLFPLAENISLTTTQRRSLADVRLTIYEQALKTFGGSKEARSRLLVGTMEQARQLWNSSRMAAKWDEVLKNNLDNIPLWTAYLDFIQSNHATFTFERCKASYLRCLAILKGASQGTATEVLLAQVYVFLRFTAFVRDAGYDELALGMWQALFELCLYGPTCLEGQHVIDFLEDFWDSEVPRIGEAESERRSNSVLPDGYPTKSPAYPGARFDQAQDIVSITSAEVKSLLSLNVPAVVDESTETDDPFSFVMFSDLRPVLMTLLPNLPLVALVNGFLTFLGLPLLPITDSHSAPAGQNNQFLSNASARRAPSAQRHFNTMQIECYQPSTMRLSVNAFNAFDRDVQSLGSDGTVLARFTDRVLDKLAFTSASSDALAEYYVAFKQHMFPDEVAGVAKRLLKQRSSSLRLYNAYALTKARIGELEKARDIWKAALNMSLRLKSVCKEDVILLRHDWLMTEFRQGDESKVFNCLQFFTGGHSESNQGHHLSSVDKLRMSKDLQHGWASMIDGQKFVSAALFAECLAIYTYHVEGLSLNEALLIIQERSQTLLRRGAMEAAELLSEAKAWLIQAHVDSKRPYKPAVIVKEVSDSLQLFPNNSVLLALSTQNAKTFQLDDRIRATLKMRLLSDTDSSIVSWSFAIDQEIRRCTAGIAGSTAESVRSLFTKALLSVDSAVAHSFALWTNWLAFEMRPENITTERAIVEQRSRAKDVIFQGLRYLPWNKAWVVIALEYAAMNDLLTREEMRQLYDVLGERQLRTRFSATLEDVLLDTKNSST